MSRVGTDGSCALCGEVVIRQKASEMIPFDTFSYVRVDAITGEEM